VAEIPAERRDVDYAPTCCMLLRSELFAHVGLMDEGYFVYCDDSDFCWRLRQAGERIVFDPAVSLFHKVSALTGQESEFSLRFLTRNTVRFVRKHYSVPSACARILLLALHTLAQGIAGRCAWSKVRIKFRAIREGLSLSIENCP
jgi:GT2 family glycosyltransferase